MSRRRARSVVWSGRPRGAGWIGVCSVLLALTAPGSAAAAGDEAADPPAAAPEVRTAALTTARAQALALYFERCDVGGNDDAAVSAASDWDGLIGLGYTPEALRVLADDIPDDCAHHSFLTVILAVESGLAATTGGGATNATAEPPAEPAPTWTAEQEQIYRDLAVDSFMEHCDVDSPYGDRRAAFVDFETLMAQGYTPNRLDELAQQLTSACDHRSFASAILGVERGAEDAENTFALQPWQTQLRGRIHEHQKGWLVPSVVFTVLGVVAQYTSLARITDGSEYTSYAFAGGFGLHAISILGVTSAEISLYHINQRIDFERDPRDLVDSLRADGLGLLILAMGGYTHFALALGGILMTDLYGTPSALARSLPLAFFATGLLHAAMTHWVMAAELEQILDRGGEPVARAAMRPRITGFSPLGLSGVW